MKCRYIVLIVVAVLLLFGTPTVLAITTGDLFSSEDDRLTALIIYTSDTEDDSYTNLAVSGAYDAIKENPNIDVGLYPYPEKATDEDFKLLCRTIDTYLLINKNIDLVIVASPRNILNPEQISKLYPNTKFVFIDSGNTSQEQLDNVYFFDFKGEESGFLTGYLAGKNTITNIVGIIMGCDSPAINRLRYGFEAGVKYAAEDMGKTIDCRVSNIDTMTDEKKGESAAIKLYQEGNGADIIMNLADTSGYGVIKAAKEKDFKVIGCDDNQSYLAPDNILCSATKKINILIRNILLCAAELKNNHDKDINNEVFDNHPINSDLDLYSGYVNIEGMHSTQTQLQGEIDNLESAIFKNLLPIPYSKETMATWSVVPIRENQAPLLIDGFVEGTS